MPVIAYDSIEVLNEKIKLHKDNFLISDETITPETALTLLITEEQRKLSQKAYSFGFDDREYWFLFELSLSDTKDDYFIDLKNIVADYADCFIFNNNQLIKEYKNGITIPINERNVKSLPIRFSMEKTTEKTTYLIRVKSNQPLYTAFSFGNLYEVNKSWDSLHFIFIFSSGIFFSLILYNLFLFSVTKEKTYILYFLYMLPMFIYDLVMMGYGTLISEFISQNTIAVLAILVNLTFVGLSYFSIYFLQLNKYRVILKNRLLFMLLLLWLSTPLFISGVFHAPYLVTIFLLLSFNMYAGVIRVIDNYKPAIFFVIATGVAGLFSIGMLLMTQGIFVPFNYFTFNLATIHMDWDLIALSLALAYRIRILQTIEKEKKHQEQLLSMLTHELKTPLSVINTALISKNPSEKLKKNASISVHNICNIMDKCLDSQRANHSSYNLNPTNINIYEFINNIATSLSKNSDIIMINVDKSLEVITDATYFNSIIRNLIENALKYKSDDSTIEIYSTYVRGWLYLEIMNQTDDNTLPDNKLIFNQFYRSPTAYKTSGAGLGLYIVKSNIEALQGTISYEVIDKNFACFKIYLPKKLKTYNHEHRN
jgi:signal transduction histidine kinase